MMNFVYNSFDVCVLSDIPENVRHFGRRVGYLEKGWCWAEAMTADLGNKLSVLSAEVIDQLKEEKQQLQANNCLLPDGLYGHPSYTNEALQPNQEQMLMQFRERQVIPGKVFTKGRGDLEHVARVLRVNQLVSRYQQALELGDLDAVMAVVEDEANFDITGMSKAQLANLVFDGSFTEPLHVAVRVGSAELVEYLIDIGARPQRDFHGRLPWEGPYLSPKCSAAAWAARRGRKEVPESTDERVDTWRLVRIASLQAGQRSTLPLPQVVQQLDCVRSTDIEAMHSVNSGSQPKRPPFATIELTQFVGKMRSGQQGMGWTPSHNSSSRTSRTPPIIMSSHSEV